MEDLSKQQIILLTLLLSFVTSIATGIMTVSLLNVAPPEITQTINRIVEKTIERVVPVETPGGGQIKEVTVIVKEEDLVIDSIEKNSKSIVRLFNGSEFYGLGVTLSSDGIVAVPQSNLPENSTLVGVFFDGATTTKFTAFEVDEKNDMLYFKAALARIPAYVFHPAVISKALPKLGQSIISVGGEKTSEVFIGRVSALLLGTPVEGSKTTPIISIKTDISESVDLGSTLINLNGELVGIKNLFEKGSYLPIANIKTTFGNVFGTTTEATP
jgi:hypothetical protein